ncbi:hypothetical protein [Alloactinosynnema sp. L-07]|uniref:DUF202 domain-containing protein n=1 Tax=Alloactinosynnema sp. L-07 TaxID=1653480 RepID=UPI00065EF38C|nr:DUF202 domain-containing protein [Alloactinosynnema sp. L-07]CRK55979.1 hypothetical protein [Alloactinosynnema sp. L-07]
MSAHIERTTLAWTRTTLAALGLAAVVIRLKIDDPILITVATVAVCLLFLILIRSNPGDGRRSAAVVGLVLVVAAVELVRLLT